MATANSVQREPSMEEILASIRRIIEDSDGGRPQPAGLAADMVETSTIDTVEDDAAGESAVPEVEVFRAELRAGNADLEPKKPVSLADVQAQLAAGQIEATIRQPAASVEPSTHTPTLAEVAAHVSAGTDNSPVSGAEEASVVGKQAKPVAAAESVASGFTPEQGDVEIDDDDLVLQDEPAPAVEPAVFRPTLVSEETSRQVAAAFGELSEAFASRSKKSFDEMAEEMLRPMLQDWLDNNLPTLVERLVREEIERVARGGA